MPRSIWSGSISFGLVNVPVRLYSAIQEHMLQFHFVHKQDNSPIGYEKTCKKENTPVPDDEIVKAFEFEQGEYVFRRRRTSRRPRSRATRRSTSSTACPTRTLTRSTSPRRTTSGPTEVRKKVYSLLVKAMEDSELAGVAKFVMRDKQHLGAL